MKKVVLLAGALAASMATAPMAANAAAPSVPGIQEVNVLSPEDQYVSYHGEIDVRSEKLAALKTSINNDTEMSDEAKADAIALIEQYQQELTAANTALEAAHEAWLINGDDDAFNAAIEANVAGKFIDADTLDSLLDTVGDLNDEWAEYERLVEEYNKVKDLDAIFGAVGTENRTKYEEVDEMDDVVAAFGNYNPAAFEALIGTELNPSTIYTDRKWLENSTDIEEALSTLNGAVEALKSLVEGYHSERLAFLTAQQARYKSYHAWYDGGHQEDSILADDAEPTSYSPEAKIQLKALYDAVHTDALEAAELIFAFGADDSVMDLDTNNVPWGMPQLESPFDTYAGLHSGEGVDVHNLDEYKTKAQEYIDALNASIDAYEVAYHNAELNRDAYLAAKNAVKDIKDGLNTADDKNLAGDTREDITDASGNTMSHPFGPDYYKYTAYDHIADVLQDAEDKADAVASHDLLDAYNNFTLVAIDGVAHNPFAEGAADCTGEDEAAVDAALAAVKETQAYKDAVDAQEAYNEAVANANANEAAFVKLFQDVLTAYNDYYVIEYDDASPYASQTANADVQAKRNAFVNKWNECWTALQNAFQAADGSNLVDETVYAEVEQLVNDALLLVNGDDGYAQAVTKANMNEAANVKGQQMIAEALAELGGSTIDSLMDTLLADFKADPRYKDIADLENNPYCEAIKAQLEQTLQDIDDLATELEAQYQAETAVEYVDGDLADALAEILGQNGGESVMDQLAADFQKHLDEVLTYYHKILPYVNDVYHDFEALQYETYGNAAPGIKEAVDDQCAAVVADNFKAPNNALKQINDEIKVLFKEHTLDEAAYENLKAKADAVTADLKAVADFIAAREAQNEENYNTLLDEYNMAVADFNNIVAGDADRFCADETDCASATAAQNVTDAKAAAQAALDAAKTALDEAHADGYLCVDPDADKTYNHYDEVLQAIDDASKAVNTDYVKALNDAEANDQAYEEFAAFIEGIQQQWSEALQAINDYELPTDTFHDQCYEELRENAVAYLTGFAQTIGDYQTGAEESYQHETLLADLAGFQDELNNLASMFGQAQNALENGIEELQANDAAYFNDFQNEVKNFEETVYTPLYNIVNGYEIPYPGHDDCYEEIREEALAGLADVAASLQALKETADYCWHHEDADYNAELEARGFTQHSMVANLDILLQALNEGLTQDLSDIINEFNTETGKLEANDEAYYTYCHELEQLEEQFTQVYNNVCNNDELEQLYNMDGEGRVELYEAIKAYYNTQFADVAAEIQALHTAADAAWCTAHNFVAQEETLYGQKEDIQIELTGMLNEFNSEIEEWTEYLENERIYRYEYQDGIEKLHGDMQDNQAILEEIAATTEYKGFPYEGAPALAEAYKALALVGACVETDKVATDNLFKEDTKNWTGVWTPATTFAYTTHCTHSEGAWMAEFNKHSNDIKTIVDPVIADIELFKANVDAYEMVAEAIESVQQHYTQYGNVTVNNPEYEGDPFVVEAIAEYNEALFAISKDITAIQELVDEYFNNRTLVDEIESLAAALEGVEIALTDYWKGFNAAVEDAHHLTNAKTIYSDQQYFTLGFFKKADEYKGEQAQEMFNWVRVEDSQLINLIDLSAYDREAVYDAEDNFVEWNYGDELVRVFDGYKVDVETLVHGTKANELSFNIPQTMAPLAVTTLEAGPATVEFLPGAITVDDWTTTHDVTIDFQVAEPVVAEDVDVVGGTTPSNKLVLRAGFPIDLTYTSKVLVATTDAGEKISFADAEFNVAKGQIEFALPEGTQYVEFPEGFLTLRVAENTIARSAALVVNVAGTTTSIDALIAMSEKAEIFDLQGRRVKVESIVKGNTYVVNGEKYIVK